MPGFLSGELTQEERRLVARYIDECSDCYAEYMRQRDVVQHLRRELPTFGRPNAPKLDAMWANIQAEIAPPQAQPTPIIAWRKVTKYAVAVFVVLFVFILPMAFEQSGRTLALPLQPLPQEVALASTPEVPKDNLTRQAVYTPSINAFSRLLQNTPAPATVGR